MFKRVLIANRGAIATRILRTLRKLNIESVVVYHEADRRSLHVQQADFAVCLGNGSVSETYLNVEKIIAIAIEQGAEAIHPGYGFLSENTDFVLACERAGLAFIGPTTEQIKQFGLKHEARELAIAANVPLSPGSPLLSSLDSAKEWALSVGFPVMLKSTAGGGGIGMQVCHSMQELISAWDSVKRLSANYFSNDGIFLEKFITNARHIEVQIFGDGNGTAISLGERDCSAQRRNQKVIEESPAPNLTDDQRQELAETAERLMASVNYRNAGTVEFIFDADAKVFYFLEVNTRLQVEHGVTEEVWGVDLVEWMIRLAAGELSDLVQLKSKLKPSGHAIQARIYAEDPAKDAQPCAGLLSDVSWYRDENIRIDTWVETGTDVPALFDPMIAKVIARGADREEAIQNLSETIRSSSLYGIETNQQYVQAILSSSACQNGTLLTNTLTSLNYSAATVDVLVAGTQTTLQDVPGRRGYWHVGVPPSGPMDALSCSLANRLLNNQSSDAVLEVLLNGPTLRFNQDTSIAICGADFSAKLDETAVQKNVAVKVKAGQVLTFGRVSDFGARAYLAIAGGFDCPDYLGSKSTFTLGQFGGHSGRALRVGDVLHFHPKSVQGIPTLQPQGLSDISDEVELRVIYGPHGAPEFFTEQDITDFFSAQWEVHYNSSRTGVRLIGPKPKWARESGGEAGMHPSNIHDNAYAFGTVDFTGDMPVILGPDGPSLGGFVCPATVITADLWKLGQLKAGCKVSFTPVTYDQACALEAEQKRQINNLDFTSPLALAPLAELPSPILHRTDLLGDDVLCRLAGDHFLLVEIGPLELDIPRRFKVHALMIALEHSKPDGVFELTPGIRSLQIHFDSQHVTVSEVITWLDAGIATLADESDLVVPSRIMHLPLSWDDVACQQAIEKYTQSVRPNAPWCPSNLEFIRRINGLDSIADVKDIVFKASYLVMGLGDVYLGAPVATPLDPRHRLVTTKYNPARTWTAENSVGIGGAYMCVYGMEGPGGYQFVGRTSQVWNRFRRTEDFTQPWLLRFFDQIRFYSVSASELEEIRESLPLGKFKLDIEETQFRLSDYVAELQDNEEKIASFKLHREQAFEAELSRWKADGQFTYQQEEKTVKEDDSAVPDDVVVIDSPVAGNVWQVKVVEGQIVEKGELLMILESMKMEIEVHALYAGRVEKILKPSGVSVEAGQSLIWLKESL